MKNSYLNFLEELYKKYSDPVKAVPMKKYMKDQFEYLGITSVPRKEIHKEFFRINGKPDGGAVKSIVSELWGKPQREYQYFGMTLMQKMEKKQGMEILPVYEFMIINKSWWDTVDFIAANLAGPILCRNRCEIPRITREWMDSGNMWLQRTALLFQLKYKDDTDSLLLFSLISELKGRKEFFIRKAIGWALREYSKTDPDKVRKFINSTELSPLSVKEGMRIILKGK